MTQFILAELIAELTFPARLTDEPGYGEQGAGGILLAPANSNSLADGCQKVGKGYSVVLIDSSINNPDLTPVTRQNNIDAGKWQRKMLELLYDAGNSPTDPWKWNQLSSDSSEQW